MRKYDILCLQEARFTGDDKKTRKLIELIEQTADCNIIFTQGDGQINIGIMTLVQGKI